jgi:hypothetical protein
MPGNPQECREHAKHCLRRTTEQQARSSEAAALPPPVEKPEWTQRQSNQRKPLQSRRAFSVVGKCKRDPSADKPYPFQVLSPTG